MTLLKKKKFFVQQNLNEILLFFVVWTDGQRAEENGQQKY